MAVDLSERKRFTRGEIETLKAGEIGVYAIFRCDTLGHCHSLYVGSGDVRAELLRRFGADEPCIQKMGATDWQYAISETANADAEVLRRELRPACP